MMVAQTSRPEFSIGLGWTRHFDLVEIATIAIGIVVMTALTMMF